MSKRNGGQDFPNRACRKFKDNPKADRLAQDEIFEILEEDVAVILQQITDARNHRGKYPTYTGQMFVNLSVPLFFWKYVKKHVKPNFKKGKIRTDLEDDQIESLKQLIADAYKRSATNQYGHPQEFEERNELLSKTFERLEARNRKLAKKLKGLEERQIRDLLIQVYTDPVVNFKYVHRIINDSTVSDKKKLKTLKKMYGDRFVAAVGAAMTIESNRSDCIDMLFQYVNGLKAKKRAPFIRAYAEAYKANETKNTSRINQEFKYKNRKIIKELKKIDIGYKKAFKNLKGENPKKKKKKAKLDGDIDPAKLGSKRFSDNVKK